MDEKRYAGYVVTRFRIFILWRIRKRRAVYKRNESRRVTGITKNNNVPSFRGRSRGVLRMPLVRDYFTDDIANARITMNNWSSVNKQTIAARPIPVADFECDISPETTIVTGQVFSRKLILVKRRVFGRTSRY